MKEKTAVFIGHNNTLELDAKLLRKVITNLIENGISIFLSGGMGGFDRISAKVVYDLKKIYPQVKNYLVIPYLNFNIFDQSLFDEIIFPEELECVPYKAAIIRRNKYMIKNSCSAICFVRNNFGGAAKSFEFAEKQGLNIIKLI